MTENRETVYSVTRKILDTLANTLDNPATRADLSNLRNSIGKPYSQTIGMWNIIFENLPEKFLSKTSNLSAEERAIITTLQLYALQQQGNSESVNIDDSEHKYFNIGNSLKSLRNGEDVVSTDRRFNTLVTSDTYNELTHHLRQMIKLLKSKSDAKVNYPKLAEDLLFFQLGYKERVILNWAREYYRKNYEKKEKGAQNE